MITYSSCLDSELVALLKQGDAASYTEIYNRYWDKLYYIAHKLLKDQQSADEVV